MSEISKSYKKDILHNGDFRPSSSSDFVMIEGIENVKQRLMHRLITKKGSLVHRPDFGVGIQFYKNSIPSIATQSQIAIDIKEQFILDANVVDVSRVSIKLDKDVFYITANVEIEGYGISTLNFEV